MRGHRRQIDAWVKGMGGETVFFQRLENGEKLKDLCEEASVYEYDGDNYDVTPGILYAWRNRKPERKLKWLEARKNSAETLVDEAYATASASTNDSVRSDKLKVDTNLWMASRFNREQYGNPTMPQPQSPITLNVAHLHLQALTAPPPPRPENDRLARAEPAQLLSGTDG